MKKINLFFLSVFIVSGIFSFWNTAAAAETCSGVATGSYYTPYSPVIIDNYERAEYVNGFLTIHFRFLPSPYSHSIQHSILFFDDTCHQFNALPISGGFVTEIPADVKNFSIRFTSQTHYEIWDDETNTKLACAKCSIDLPETPAHFSVVFNLYYPYSFNNLNTRAYSIREPQPPPPVRTGGLTPPSTCPTFETHGGDAFDSYPFFDNYWFAEYQNGFLNYHFRFINGRPHHSVWPQWLTNFSVYDKDCNYVGNVRPVFPIQNGWLTDIEPYSRYWSIRFTSPTHFEVWNDDLNRREDCTYCSGDLDLSTVNTETPRIQIKGDDSTGIYFGRNYSFSSVPFPIEEPRPATPDPVIIIPGILGSAEKNGVWVIDPIFHTYDNLIDTLEANGYVKDHTLFTLPYDWRNSNASISVLLHRKIDEVQQICDCAKVDLVAHSMGGLAARDYIQGSTYEGDVDQLIFLGTPHLGAPETYLMWEGGEIKPTNFFKDIIVRRSFSSEARNNGYSNIFDYIRDFPVISVRQLLPVINYLKEASSEILRVYPNNYPSNQYLENLNDGISNLFNSGVRITNIVGDIGSSTVEKIRVTDSWFSGLWEHGYPENFDVIFSDHGLELGLGDGTVLLSSASFVNSDVNIRNSEHRELPTEAEDLVFKKLTNFDTQKLIKKSLINRLLSVTVHSPADIVVIAPDGKRIGKDFQTGQEFNEIEGAFYSGYLTDNEFITIPNPLDGEYKIETQGTGNGGEYTIVTSYISDTSSAEAEFTGQTAPGLVTSLDVLVDNSQPENLVVVPTDIVPPVIFINSPEGKDYLRSEVFLVDAVFTDIDSGVFSSQISLDGEIIDNGSSKDLFFRKLGNHLLSATATDFIGNISTSTIDFRIVATIDSIISDIERSYLLGWIKSEKKKNELVKMLNKYIKKSTDDDEDDGEGKRNEELEKFRKKIGKERGKSINEQAYQLLLEDINWMLDNE